MSTAFDCVFCRNSLRNAVSRAMCTPQSDSPSPSKDHATAHQSFSKTKPVFVLTAMGSGVATTSSFSSGIAPIGSSGTIARSPTVTASPFATTTFPLFTRAMVSLDAASMKTGVSSAFTTIRFPARLPVGVGGLTHELPPRGSDALDSMTWTAGVKPLNLCTTAHCLIVLVALLTTVTGTSWPSRATESSSKHGAAEAWMVSCLRTVPGAVCLFTPLCLSCSSVASSGNFHSKISTSKDGGWSSPWVRNLCVCSASC
mmetsp:Transcript_20406/g.61522  ORF Transcript_20406/g.61522 Transcript_20406/m.61522 type:complete len:257 (+) Transcript_20406:458-1228(+)